MRSSFTTSTTEAISIANNPARGYKTERYHEPTSQLFKLHAQLDAIVLQAYGFKPDDDLLEKLLTLNLELAEKEKNGEAVPSELRSALIVGPWAPTKI